MCAIADRCLWHRSEQIALGGALTKYRNAAFFGATMVVAPEGAVRSVRIGADKGMTIFARRDLLAHETQPNSMVCWTTIRQLDAERLCSYTTLLLR